MRKFGLVGKSLSHSFSKEYFMTYFDENQIEATYTNIEIKSSDSFEDILQETYEGLNITVPYKESVIPFLDEVIGEANIIGAVNVIKFHEGRRIGYNSDAYGFHQSIKPFLTGTQERALVFGTGGAAKAVEYVLNSLGIEVNFVSRSPCNENEYSYGDLNEIMISSHKLLVNCTPLGTYPKIDEAIKIPYESITKDHLVIDLVYNPAKSKFLELSELNGASILNGKSMLEHQAMRSWEIWNS